MTIPKQHTLLFNVYILFLAGLVLAYHLTLGAAVAAATIGLIVGRYEVIEKAGAAANRRLCRLIAVLAGLGLGIFLAVRGDVLAVGAVCVLGGIYLLVPESVLERSHS